MNQLHLADYPQAIAAASANLNAIERDLEAAKRSRDNHEARADYAIAFDTDLKNDGQRRAKRAELMLENVAYQGLLNAISTLSSQQMSARVELERLRNEFSVAKLEARLRLVELAAGSEFAREFVGL